jgi:hypothetical protein
VKIFLAGCEDFWYLYLTEICKYKYMLFSYYHWKGSSAEKQKKVSAVWERFPQETICDSGLFTLMFGCGKGGKYDLSFMKEYTKNYIEAAKNYKINQLTIVESDVHKLLGMKSVFELRKQFEDSGMNVIYVWHREEGIEGLYRMAEKYNYIAISVPELRILCKNNVRYQDAVKDLERKILANVNRLPKIHLLGNTVMETMETNVSYSCDSTSWKAGGRWGKYIHYTNGTLKPKILSDKDYLYAKHLVEKKFPDEWNKMVETYRVRSEKCLQYMLSSYLAVRSYAFYQGYLDKNYQCIRGGDYEDKRKNRNCRCKKSEAEQMEPERTV